ncbi:PF06127 family protein [Caballeronia udeis]|uniref:PF06127 family protein n=1 Tax=Caballeronia udeis TaxID=1232866 RepID=A0A158I0R5_9BURK|nr:Mpo1-like protein [Caballeronia udeis]SAL50204.1 PF06127 family protein [Caballeronia udeis]
MKSLVDQLGQYAVYHRDSRNIASHLIGIPLIVVAVATLLSRPSVGVTATLALSPAMLLAAAVAVFYLRLDLRFGILMMILLALSVWTGKLLAMQTTALWLAWGLGLFFVGWVIQFIGHYFEGSKPAFVDDVIGLAVGPLFIVAEVAFFLGLRNPVRRAIEQRAGPIRGAAGKSAVR